MVRLSLTSTHLSKLYLLLLLLLGSCRNDPAVIHHTPQPSITMQEGSAYTICFLKDGFSIETPDGQHHQLPFGSDTTQIKAILGEPQNQLGFHDDLLWSYPQWALLLWLEAPSLSLSGVILTAHQVDNPYHIQPSIHFYHEAIDWTHAVIHLYQDLYKAQAIGKTFGYYRISQATFRSHENYLLIDHLDPQQHYVAVVAYSQRNPEPYLRRYYPSDRLYALPY